MSSSVRKLIARVRRDAVRRPAAVRTLAMGRERVFHAYDLGPDTYVFEDGIGQHLHDRPSVLVAQKCSLRRRSSGFVMTISTGNHSVAAFPLLDGRFWKLSSLASAKRGEVLMHAILCANVVDGRIETSQRDVSTARLVAFDNWLLETAGLGMEDVVMADRNEQTIEHYHAIGQEWRIKPLAWTAAEMRVALNASRKRISSSITYYHSSRGVHFLSFAEFRRFAALAEAEPEAFVKALREIVSVDAGQRYSFTRLPKYRGHHEIELFGLKLGVALERIVPKLDDIMEAVTLGRTGQLGIIHRVQECVRLYESLLSRPEFADDNSPEFIEAMYMHITGEIYAVSGEGSTPSFDDRRTAIAGATFVDGAPIFHPTADERSRNLLANLRRLMSRDEVIYHANVYDIREENGESSAAVTREVVFATNRNPLERSLIEKRLSSGRRDYGSYMLSRVGALRSLGVALSPYYRLLYPRDKTKSRAYDYYIRFRCEGEPMGSIPASYFRASDDATAEDREVVLAMAMMMGDAAAQNMAMKKYDPVAQSALYGVGKEIYEFEYDLVRQRVVPKRVTTCSIRGSFGWPDLSHTDENIAAIGEFYLGAYARSLGEFARHHRVEMTALAERFMDGFEYRTRQMEWQLGVMRDKFEDFSTGLPPSYRFDRKWKFVMWSLERQARRLHVFKKLFFEKVRVIEDETLRHHPEPVRL